MNRYVRHYDIPLLDDIHNYFPAILYEPEAFRNVQDVLAYIRTRVRERFDLFSAGQQGYTRIQPVQVNPQTPTTTTNPVTTAPTMVSPPRTMRASHSLFTEFIAAPTSLENTLINMFAGMGAPLASPPQMFMEPVVVHPTAEQIENNTSIELMDAESDQCAICQDTMSAGTEVRSLDACDHRFHIHCIDTWFLRDVHCPICRHDIREP